MAGLNIWKAQERSAIRRDVPRLILALTRGGGKNAGENGLLQGRYGASSSLFHLALETEIIFLFLAKESLKKLLPFLPSIGLTCPHLTPS